MPYAELHVHSDFSFLDGASDPESLIEEAARLRLAGLALTDHDGFYAAARFAEAAKAYDLPTVYGAELSLGLTVPQNGVADPEGEHLLVLARGVEGYHRLSAAITEAQLRGDEKGRPLYDLDELAAAGGGALAGPDRLPQGSAARRADPAREAGRPTRRRRRRGPGAGRPGRPVRPRRTWRSRSATRPADRLDDQRRAGRRWPPSSGLPLVATNNVHFATPEERRLAAAMAAVRARRSLAEMDGWLPPPGRPPALGPRDGAALRPLPRRGGDLGPAGRRVRLQPAAGQAAGCPSSRCRPATRPAIWLRELCRRGPGGALPARAARRSPGSGWSASSRSSRRRTSPATS